MKTFTISEARNSLPSLLDRISSLKTPVIITRRGKPLAKIVPFRGKTKNEKTRYPLRGTPLRLSDDFDAPLPNLWNTLAP